MSEEGNTNMKTKLFVLALAFSGLGVAGIASYADHDDEDRVEDLMEKTHEGKRSPYRQLKREASSDTPSWKIIEATLPTFEEMSRALRESKVDDIKGSSDGYVDAVGEVVTATRTRDAISLKRAVGALSDSCGDCHFKGGVGGELDE